MVEAKIGYTRSTLFGRLEADFRQVVLNNAREWPNLGSVGDGGFGLFRQQVAEPEDMPARRAEFRRFLMELTGSELVFVGSPSIRGQDGPNRPALRVHMDYTPEEAWKAASTLTRREGVEIDRSLRLIVFGLWAVISDPPQDRPLALCDCRSVGARDLIATDRDGSHFYLVRHNPHHRWGYFPDMTKDELVVFRQHDSRGALPSGVPHASFFDPSCGAAAPRRSVEARGFVFLS